MDHRSAVLVLTFLAAAALALTASPKHSYSHVKRDDVTAQTSWTGFDNCTEDQKTTLKQAAKDMRNIAFEGLIKFDRDIGPCDKYPCKNSRSIRKLDWQRPVVDASRHDSKGLEYCRIMTDRLV